MRCQPAQHLDREQPSFARGYFHQQMQTAITSFLQLQRVFRVVT
jgi:hypothetical protein